MVKFFKSLFYRVMYFFGYEPYIKISTDEARPVWHRSWVFDWKNIRNYLKLRMSLRNLKVRHSFTFYKRRHRVRPYFMEMSDNGTVKRMDFFIHEQTIKNAIENPVNHIGNGTKVGYIQRGLTQDQVDSFYESRGKLKKQ